MTLIVLSLALVSAGYTTTSTSLYLNKNVSREYDHYRDIKTNRILDTGLDLWG